MKKEQYIAWLEDINKDDIPLVGGKGANLGEMFQAKIPVPYAFVITSTAYFQFIKTEGLDKKIKALLSVLNHHDPHQLNQTAGLIQKLILSVKIPDEIAREIMFAYLDLSTRANKKQKFAKLLASYLKNPLVAIRSSATAEDLPGASFAGQQDTYLNVEGEANVLRNVHHSWASLFNPRAIFYRQEQKFDHMKVGIASVVQMMVSSVSSGVMFTVDPVTNDKNRITIEAILGLGELIVQGSVTPDHFEVDKKSMKIMVRQIGDQAKMMYKKGTENVETSLSNSQRTSQKIADADVYKVTELGKRLEKHYFFPQDIEWAIEDGNIYIVQTRPITTFKEREKNQKPESKAAISALNLKLLIKGDPASPGIKSGPVKIIQSAREIEKVLQGEVLVTVQTNPDFVPAMKKAVAIVTERGGRTSHAAIVSRELGIPAVVGTGSATTVLKTGQIVTVDGAKGEIYEGAFEKQLTIIKEKTQKPKKLIKTATRVYVNLATPNRIDEVSKMNCDGIGLLRAEFMIADIGVHPRKLIRDKKQSVFTSKLGADLLKFCKAFNPRPVVYRATDFKTNEYRNLIGGKEFEPEEPNPMLGYRGAFRYMSDPQVFNLELETIKMVRNKHGFKNLWLMLPFVRTVTELVEVKKIIAASGLMRSPTFKLWMMVEIPSNVILLDQFCEAGIDGVSIGSNDLTMLILGTDRDNTEVAPEFDERNDAVTWAIERVVRTCKKYNVTSSICGQAPSDYPELVEKLVKWGITSMSVNADAIDSVRETVFAAEQKLAKK